MMKKIFAAAAFVCVSAAGAQGDDVRFYTTDEIKRMGEAECVPYAKIEPRVIPPVPESANFLFVAPDGDDSAAGTVDAPLATWRGAADRVRKLRADGLKGGMCVYFRGGEYRVASTTYLTKEDSGSEDFRIVYRAYGNEKPVFTSGFEIGGFGRVSDPDVLARLPGDEARAAVRVCDLSKTGFAHAREKRKTVGYEDGGKNRVQDLYFNGSYLPLARFPNDRDLHATNIVDRKKHVFRPCSAVGDLSAWAKEPDLMARGYWIWCWADFTDRIAVDVSKGTFAVTPPHPFGMMAKWNPNVYYCILNALHALDREGEWYLDARTAKLYVWPKKPVKGERNVYTLSSFDGTFLELKDLSHVEIRSLGFEYGRGRAVVADNCRDFVFAANEILNFGGEGFKMTNARDVTIWGNRFLGFGRAAMDVRGGDRKNLVPSGIRIENNEIGDTSHTLRTYTPGLRLYGCGTKVVYNHFHDIASSAIRLEGNDFLISMNLVERAVMESGDQGAVDIYGDPSYFGNVYSYNIWRDIGVKGHGQAGIRFDDRICGQIVYGNRFDNASDGVHFGGVQINGGRWNVVDNNVFTLCGIGISITEYTRRDWIRSFKRKSSVKMTEEDVNIYKPPYTLRYPGIENLPETLVQSNLFTRNVFVGTGPLVKTPEDCPVETYRNWRFGKLPDLDDFAEKSGFSPLPDEAGIGTY